ncbi:zinc transporter ZIP4 [Strigops habroptila]|uniref:zinc transporter ZIP4 n=1 Tax=Strigops habroptila TaxID=2489341 RepID=UPI00140255D9|nr:zinc transporter ZIP4 [Strigops habroptila]
MGALGVTLMGWMGCLDAGAVLAAGAAVSPRVGAGRVLAALGALVLRGRCLRPTGPPAAPAGTPRTPGTPIGSSDGHPEALPWATLSLDPPEVLLEMSQLGDTPTPPRTPPDPLPRHGDPTTDPTGNVTAAPGPTDQLSTLQRYALGSAAGLVLALAPLLALLLLRCPLRAGTWRWLHPLLLGGAAGALSGDGILHLLPQVLGLHDHGGAGDVGHEDGGAAEPHWKLMTVLGGIYGAFLLERLGGGLLIPDEVKVDDTNLDQSTEELQSRSRWVLPVMTSVGAAAHSLADGLALGAAFAGSWRAGAAAGAGLLLHELPHALGDAAVLAHAPSARARRRALWLRVAGAAPALPGLWAGLALGGGGAGAWVRAAAAGAVLHLAMADMLPALLAMRDPHPWVLLGVQSLGLALGWGTLLLLALYEDSIVL